MMWLIPFVLTGCVLTILCFTDINGLLGTFICIIVFFGSIAIVHVYNNYRREEHVKYLRTLSDEKLEERFNNLLNKVKKKKMSKRDADELDLLTQILDERAAEMEKD